MTAVIAIGLLDGSDLLRLTMAPDATQDDELAQRIVEDLADPARGVFAAGAAYLEAPVGVRVRDLLIEAGWRSDEPWTPLELELAGPVEAHDLRIEVVDPRRADARVAVQRAAFDTSTFTVEAWAIMAAAPAFTDARDLIGYDADDIPVAAITVWSAGTGRPGLIEPMGVAGDHRGRGYGRAITLAGAAALRELGASSATVCTKSSKVGAVATYRAAGMAPLPERLDLARDA